jgi:type IV secretion system protein VirB1
VLDFLLIAQQCAPAIHPNTLAHVVQVESSYNPFAIGVVGAHLERQPHNAAEAIATADWLERNHFNYSVGLGQVNRSNFIRYGLTLESAFDPCRNLQATSAILKDCYLRAYEAHPDEQTALRDSFSCYYSGNFTAGYKAGYVIKVIAGGAQGAHPKKAPPGPKEVASEMPQTPSALLF